MAEEILGIAFHMDISDIDRAITEIIDNLDKIGVKTDVLSKRMSEAMKEIASSTDDAATKQKRAMEVFAQATTEAKAALANYPEQMHNVKDAMQQTEIATQNLEKQLASLNAQLQDSVVGSEKYNQLKSSIAGVEQQIESNTRTYQAQAQVVEQMEAGYNGLVSMMGVANTSTAANAVAHGAVTAATMVEATAHTNNTQKIEEETKAVLENKSVKDYESEEAKKVADAVQLEMAAYEGLAEKVRQGKITNEEYERTLEAIRSRIAALREEQRGVGQKYDLEEEKATTFDMVNGEPVSRGNIDVVNELEQQYKVLEGQIVALQGTLNETEKAWDSTHQKATEGAGETTSKVKETTQAIKEEQNEASKEPSGFKAQWEAVNEMHSKLRELTTQLKEYEAEYDKMAEKPGFDAESKKAKELQEKIAKLKQEISETRAEMKDETGAGGLLGRFKNAIVDAMTGNGKFQASLGNIKAALAGLLGPFTAATGGAMAFAKSLWAIVATPIGAIIGAIVLGLQAIHTWMTKDAEGQKAFAKITAYVGSLMSSIMDIAVKVGKYLYHAFTDPQGSFNQFGKGLVGMVINPLKVVAKTLSGVGQIAKGVYDLIASGANVLEAKRAAEEIAKGWEDLKQAGKSTIDTVKSAYNVVAGTVSAAWENAGTALKTLWEEDLSKLGGDFLGKAQRAAQLAGEELEAQKELSEAKMKQHQLDIKIAEEREKIYTLTGKEKDKQIELVKNLLKEKYDPQIKAQQKLLDIQKERNNLHTKSLEQLSQEREAQGSIYQLQAQQAASTRMLVRMQQANLRKMENEGKQANKKDTAVQEATTNWEETVRKNSYARAKAEEKIEQAVTDAKIAAMKDGAEKVLAEKNRAFEKELEQLDEQRKAAIEAERTRQKAEFEAQEKIIKARGGKSKQWSEDEVDKTAIDAINAQYESLKKLAVQRQQNDETQKQVQAMQDYLIQYGSMQEKRKAITEKYNKDIANAEAQGYAGEVAKLRKQLEDELASLDMQKIKNSINWEAIFNDLDKLSNAALEDLKTKLKKALNDKDITPENAKVLSEKLLEIDNRLSDNMWTSMIPALKERQRLLNEIKSSEEDIARAQKNQSNAFFKAQAAQTNLQNIAQVALGRTLTKEELGYGSGTELVGKLKVVGDSAEQLKTAFDNNKLATNNLTKTQEELTAAQQQGKHLNDMLSKLTGKGSKDQNSGSALKSIFTSAAESNGGGFIGYAKLAQDNINSMAEFTDKIGLAGTDFGNAVHGFADGVNGFMSAIQSLASGDVFGAINGIIDGITGLGKGFASIFVGNLDNHEEMVKIQKEANSQLQLINDRVAKISDKLSSSYGATAISTFEELKQYLQSSQQQYNAGLQAAGNDRYGGANSEWWHRNKNGGEGAGGYVERLKQQYGLNFQGTSWQDFFNYISTLEDGKGAKILHDLRENSSMVDIWNELMRTNSYDEGAIADWIKRWADSYDEVQKSIDTLNERLTTTTKENVFDDYLNSLYNLSDGSKDVFKEIADNWQKMVNRMVVNNIVGAKQQKALEDWYENYLAKAYSDDVKTYQKNLKDAKEKYDEILKQGVDEINRLKEMGIINTTSEYQQTATGNSIQNISYDQADAIEGIMLGHTIILERTLNETVEQTGIMGNIDAGVQQIGAQVVDIREGVQVMIETQGSMNSHLAQISENTRVLPEVRDEIVRVRKLVEQQ